MSTKPRYIFNIVSSNLDISAPCADITLKRDLVWVANNHNYALTPCIQLRALSCSFGKLNRSSRDLKNIPAHEPDSKSLNVASLSISYTASGALKTVFLVIISL